MYGDRGQLSTVVNIPEASVIWLPGLAHCPGVEQRRGSLPEPARDIRGSEGSERELMEQTDPSMLIEPL